MKAQRPCPGGCGRLKTANEYELCRWCAIKAKHGADCWKRWRQLRGATHAEHVLRRQATLWRERFPGVPWPAARSIYLQGYKAGAMVERKRHERGAAA